MRLPMAAVVLAGILFAAGCATSINTYNSQTHARAAEAALEAGDWDTARRQWAKALVNAQLAGLRGQQLAILNYEYGRALGVQCFWDEAEKYLLKALELDRLGNGPDFMSLTELSHLHYDHKQFDKAVSYYEPAVQALEAVGAPDRAPAGFADILDEYATALRNIGDVAKAKAVSDRASGLRKTNPDGQSITDRTPYGTQCVSQEK